MIAGGAKRGLPRRRTARNGESLLTGISQAARETRRRSTSQGEREAISDLIEPSGAPPPKA
jgi:hypothetical protein